MKILIAPNSFKRCADSVKIAEILSSCFSGLHGYEILSKPVSDGGDGFLNVCGKNLKLKKISYQIPAPYGRKYIKTVIGYSEELKEIYIESAKVLGLNLIPPVKRHPLKLSSRGMGVLLRKIILDVDKKRIKPDKIVIGIGGTGTNDMGIGMLSELGMKFYGKGNKEIVPIPANFLNVMKITRDELKLPFKIDIITDVDNPLLGINGASNIFGRQKGLTSEEIYIANAGFNNIAAILRNEKILKGVSFLSGAGGGLAAGFQILGNSKLVSSDKFMFEDLGLGKIKKINVVITAEGAFDQQSFMNKATGTIVKRFAGKSRKIFLVCGIIDRKVISQLPKNVYPIEISKYFKSKKDSIANYEKGLQLASEEIFKLINI